MVVDRLSERQQAAARNLVVGRIVRITEEDVALVEYPGNSHGPLEAFIAVEPPEGRGGEWPPVLMAFLNGDPSAPVIIGFVRRKFSAPKVVRTRKRVALDADEEIAIS